MRQPLGHVQTQWQLYLLAARLSRHWRVWFRAFDELALRFWRWGTILIGRLALAI
jgi:hypothetical protein